jgi:hypothetical protein
MELKSETQTLNEIGHIIIKLKFETNAPRLLSAASSTLLFPFGFCLFLHPFSLKPTPCDWGMSRKWEMNPIQSDYQEDNLEKYIGRDCTIIANLGCIT